jgi:methyltransferase
MFLLLLAAAAFAPMLLEARRSAKNDRALRAAGAAEPAGDVYPAMRIAYPTSFAAMLAEAWLRRAEPDAIAAAGAAVFIAAKAVKYWAVAALGDRWTFRVLVPPGGALVSSGPYRFLQHPNYVAVVGELGGMALMCKAAFTGAVALAAFSLIILGRIAVEERAIGLRR